MNCMISNFTPFILILQLTIKTSLKATLHDTLHSDYSEIVLNYPLDFMELDTIRASPL